VIFAQSSVYLDHAATTPLHPDVAFEMKTAIDLTYGNPSSLHTPGNAAKRKLDSARENVAKALGCDFPEVIFCSGGTEAAHLTIVGAALANEDTKRNRILLSSIEHHCVLGTIPHLQRLGYKVDLIQAKNDSEIDLNSFADLLQDDVFLTSLMSVNNETGMIQPLKEAIELTKKFGALYHCDHVQGFKKTDIDPIRLGADLVTITAHKINGPKGTGAAYVRAGTKIKPVIEGGEQEREQRGGTENVIGILGFGSAVRQQNLPDMSHPRDVFLDLLIKNGAVPTCPKEKSISTHAHVRFPEIDAETVLIRLDREGIYASSGAACSSGSVEASHVLIASGFSESEAKEGLRFTFGYQKIEDQFVPQSKEWAIFAAEKVNQVINEIRSKRKN
jgi:cysteine desulfurase